MGDSMVAAFKTAITLLLVTPTLAAHDAVMSDAEWHTGNPSCPCIDPWRRNLQPNGNAGFANAAIPCNLTRSSDSHCFSARYGSDVCSWHDHSESPDCNVANPAAWCLAKWCWIDPYDCSRPNHVTNWFPNVTYDVYDSGSGEDGSDVIGNGRRLRSSYEAIIPAQADRLTYSYETCGYVNNFGTRGTSQRVALREAARLRPGGELRITIPPADNPPYVVSHEAYPAEIPSSGGVGGTNRSGAVPVLLDRLLTLSSVPWRLVPISQSSYNYSVDSSYTACVHEIAIGNADMCWANIWTTSARRTLATFSGQIYSDNFYLVTNQSTSGGDENQTFIDQTMAGVHDIFAPFSPDLWLGTLIALCYTGMVLIFMAEQPESLRSFCTSLPTSLLRGASAFNTAEVPDAEKSTVGAWFLSLLLGFIVLVLQTNYTSIVTTSRVAATSTGQIANLQQAINARHPICAMGSAIEPLVALHPTLQGLLVPTTLEYPDALDGMDSGWV